MVYTLTEQRLKTLQPRPEPYSVCGGKGLYIKVTPQGAKLWRVRFKHQGRAILRSLGCWPEVSVRRAGELADDLRRDIRSGVPAEGDAGPCARIFRDLAADWGGRFLAGYSPKEIARKQDYLNRIVFPAIGDLPLPEVTPLIVLERLLRPLEAQGKLVAAGKVKSLVGMIFRYGIASGQAERDPTRDLAGALRPPRTVHRAAILDPAALGGFLNAAAGYEGTPPVAYALRILPYVFVRPGELRNAEWAELDLGQAVWTIPAGRMKMRTPHLVPLSRQVMALLKGLKASAGKGRLLFPGCRSADRPISDVTLTAALRRMGFTREEVCPHGFRATASTLLNQLGYPPDWIERQLAHTERNGVRAAYNHADYFQDRKRMMQEWADYLDRLAGGTAA